MTENVHCPKCKSDITYPQDNKMVCTQCFHEWNPEEKEKETEETVDFVDKSVETPSEEKEDLNYKMNNRLLEIKHNI